MVEVVEDRGDRKLQDIHKESVGKVVDQEVQEEEEEDRHNLLIGMDRCEQRR